MIKLFVIGCLLSVCLNIATAQNAQATINFWGVKKSNYAIGDTLRIKIQVNIPPEICSDGMQKTKIYLSGLDIIEQSQWNAMDNRNWAKEMTLKVRPNKKGMGKITAFRKADKGEFFIQEKISIAE
ncbi:MULTISPECIES: hypothetical protein [unclassified Saccharicrinis]|uniref:hypothetical protein n=1 Tax=unclassified Saccharicrinis TaxID=2646859 RepID=UPI003D32E72A